MADQNASNDQLAAMAKAAFADSVKESYADRFIINDNAHGVRIAFGTMRLDGTRFDNAVFLPEQVFNDLVRLGADVAQRRAAGAQPNGQKPN